MDGPRLLKMRFGWGGLRKALILCLAGFGVALAVTAYSVAGLPAQEAAPPGTEVVFATDASIEKRVFLPNGRLPDARVDKPLRLAGGAIILPQAEPQDEAGEEAGDEAQNEAAEGVTGEAKDEAGAASSGGRWITKAEDYDFWVIAPSILAVLFAIFFRRVVPALMIGIVAGAYMIFMFNPAQFAVEPGQNAFLGTVAGGFRLSLENYVIGSILAPASGHAHLKILIFTLIIGFTFGVLQRNGGAGGMARWAVGEGTSPRKGMFSAWLAGLIISFDFYANSLIVGPTWRSIFDKLKLSRAKLAYIVDGTAAPAASIALIGTWIGAEIGFIREGLNALTPENTPAFLQTEAGLISPMNVFLQSILYRFYAIFAIILVFFVAVLRRDFGSMKAAERRALMDQDTGRMDGPTISAASTGAGQPLPKHRGFIGLLPVLALLGVILAILIQSGRASLSTDPAELQEFSAGIWYERWGAIFGGADSYVAILYGAALSAVFALFLTLFARGGSLRDATDAGLDGMSRVVPAIVILVLAWGLSQVCLDLKLPQIVSARLLDLGFPLHWMPTAIFLTSAMIAFATGASWGTMGIVCPMAVSIPCHLAVQSGVGGTEGYAIFLSGVGAVLAGSLFGAHCSPISDTTVFSSLASGCRHEEHVWTQAPYALLGAAAALGANYLCDQLNQPAYVGLASGVGAMFLFLLIFGRTPKRPPMPVAPRAVPQTGPPRRTF